MRILRDSEQNIGCGFSRCELFHFIFYPTHCSERSNIPCDVTSGWVGGSRRHTKLLRIHSLLDTSRCRTENYNVQEPTAENDQNIATMSLREAKISVNRMIMMRSSENKPEYFRGHQNNCASPWPTWETHSTMIRDNQRPCSDRLTWLFSAAFF